MSQQQHQDVQSSGLDPSTAYAELSRIMLGSQPLSAVLGRVAELAKQTVRGIDEVSVTLVEGDRARTAVFTGDLAAHLDERQYDAGFGPCLDAAAAGATVRIDDTTHEDRYADFADVARRHGVRSTLSVGLPVAQRTIGALNMYIRSEVPLDEDAEQLAWTFAGYAGVALFNAALYASTTELVGQMQEAMQSRAAIEQAKGIIMAHRRCWPDEAFAVLVRRSQDENRKLRVIAEEVVAAAGGGGGAASG